MKETCGRCGARLNEGESTPFCSSCLLMGGRSQTDSRAAFEAPSIAEIGQRFPDLEIIELLGQGGMGAVYRARQPRLDRMVALKILRPEAAQDPRFTERFLQEARVLAKLSHPSIVGVFDFGVEGDLHWLMMEYVDGANLRDVLAAGALPPKDALALVPHICEALQYAHDNGVVHRDIKPENILLDLQHRIRIADFGLARLAGGDVGAERLTRSYEVFGTPRYMAPEQLEGALHVDHRADIYALGAVLYELLTGELPLGRFPAPSTIAEMVDARIDEVVLRALEKKPADRYQHASEVKDAIHNVESGPEPVVPEPTPPHEDRLWSALLIACLVMAFFVVLSTDHPFLLFLLLFLPGCGFGAVMANPNPSSGDQAAAYFILVVSVVLTFLAMFLHEEFLPVFALLSFAGGIGAGYAEERKRFEVV